MTALITTTGLTRRFGTVVAVDQLAFSIEKGSIWGLLGPNGAGKSTLLKMLTTLLPPTAGSATIGGFDVVRQPREVRRRIGYLPQMVSADGALTGYENLMLSARLQGIPATARRERVDHALRSMGLEQDGHRLVSTYSGGMIRRLELGQALMHRPLVLFLDEPTIGLDPIGRQQVWDLLLDSRARFDTTVCLTTHDLEEAEVLCDTLAILNAGRIVAEGTPRSVMEEVGPAATLGEAFIHFAGGPLAGSGSYRDVRRTRRTVRRLK